MFRINFWMIRSWLDGYCSFSVFYAKYVDLKNQKKIKNEVKEN